MRIFEKLVLKQELSSIMNLTVGNDQFAYKEKHNTTMHGPAIITGLNG